MSSEHEIHVSIGEVKVGRGDDILKATLGSCVGIGLLWREKRLYGLAHSLLPSGPVSSLAVTGRFVTQAVPSLIALMHIPPEEFKNVDAVIVGGGNMTAPKGTDEKGLVGFQNTQMAEQLLQKHGFKIIFRDVGGELGRQFTILCSDGTFAVKKIPRMI